MHRYRINQFVVESELLLPCEEWPHASDGAEGMLLRIRYQLLGDFAQVTWLGTRPGTSLRSYDVGTGVLIGVDRGLRFHIDWAGESVDAEFQTEDRLAASLAKASAVNLVISVCTLLRGGIPLHGAGVDLDGSRIALLAPSGAGKSTLLWSLLDQGATLVSDDVVSVRAIGKRIEAATSGALHAKLSRHAIEARGANPEELQPVLPDCREYWVPISSFRRAMDARPLSAVFLLFPREADGHSDRVMTRQIMGGAAFAHLIRNTQALWSVSGRLDGRALFGLYDALVRSVPVFALEYEKRLDMLPRVGYAVREVLGTIQHREASARSDPPRRLGSALSTSQAVSGLRRLLRAGIQR